MLANLILFLSIINPFFDQYSVATVRRSPSLLSNPAGLAIVPGVEFSYRFETSDDEWSHYQNFLLGNLGFGIRTVNEKTDYQAGIGFAQIKKTLYFGYSYEFGDAAAHNIGAIIRPMKFASMGVTTRFADSTRVRAGIALRPLTDRMTVFGDGIYDGDSVHLLLGVALEPVPGLTVAGQSDLDGNFRVGLELSLGRLKCGGSIGEGSRSGGVVLSTRRYPSILPPGRKLVKLTLAGKYDEDRQQRGLVGLIYKREPAFYQLISSVKKVRESRDAYGLYLKLEEYSLSTAQYEELAQELGRVRQAGKKIIIFANTYKSLAEYRAVSEADYLILAELGDVVIPGVWARKFYLKGMLDRLGLETDIDYVGEFKSAHEQLSRKDMSGADSLQWSEILDGIYEPSVEQAARNRKLTREEFEKLINEKAFFNSDDAKKCNLIDTTAFFYEVDELVKKYTGKEVSQIDAKKFVQDRPISRSWKESRSTIALVIAEGSIVTGKSGYNPMPVFGGKYIGSESLARIFERIRKNKSIKAVVFRINSGGGSALASDIICEAVRKCNKVKPVVVSMGGVAGSGGYYIACPARRILANQSTITGSIGVVSVKLVTPRFYDEKLGITWDWIKRGEHVDALSDMRHFSEAERMQFHQETEWWYNRFLNRVAQGRKLETAFVDSVGKGRIWSGKKASKLGLVDEVGGLLDAIEVAKKEARIKGEAEIVFFPKPEKKLVLGTNANVGLMKMLGGRWLYIMPYRVEIE